MDTDEREKLQTQLLAAEEQLKKLADLERSSTTSPIISVQDTQVQEALSGIRNQHIEAFQLYIAYLKERLGTSDRSRKCWQIHLSTMLLLTVLAGAFVWLNVRPYYEDEVSLGWPFTIYRPYLWGIGPEFDRSSYDWLAFAANMLVAVAGLALAGYVSEKIFRRRGA